MSNFKQYENGFRFKKDPVNYANTEVTCWDYQGPKVAAVMMRAEDGPGDVVLVPFSTDELLIFGRRCIDLANDVKRRHLERKVR